ncbi:dioxygenase [Nitratireductor sp. CAU 1489]|uniref:Dioxygenase n=1 Tax=Nitratireductor arenosus TaxID=2682096 RepID=A0A844QI06_9HYPH|nr:class III extradiol ring-cleavage dioxygenase [Nitratireductor arenosus]MVA97610.1 dioxygenase [Nitratireductor arenosus]
MSTIPSLFISHGGPNIVTDDTPARDFLKSLSGLIPRPKAIVIVSAHFETGGVSVVTDPKPGMIYDFGGFAPELYQMVYPAPGSPELAGRVVELLAKAGLAPTHTVQRGFDHGTWTPLLLAYPQADIPVVQVSVDPDRDARWHYAVGCALAPLAKEGVLMIGSGHITHNLRAVIPVMRGGASVDQAMVDKVEAFTGWLAEHLAVGDIEALLDWKTRAPYPVENHPSDEHLMPLFFAVGAAGEAATGTRVHASRQFGLFAFDAYLFSRSVADDV